MHLTHPLPQASFSRRIVLTLACLALALATSTAALALHLSAPSPQVKVAGGVMAGESVSKVPPVYPADAKAAHVQGTVLLRAVIGRDGLIKDLSVISGPDALRSSALEAVSQWHYKPYLLNGEPVEVETTITVNYSLGR